MATFETSKSFSGCDIIPIGYAELIDSSSNPFTNSDSPTFINGLFELGVITTISYSIHTDKRPVAPCGYKSPKAFVSGIQTIAGTMIFSVLGEHPLSGLMSGTATMSDYLKATNDISLLPPFDLTLLIGNEYGSASILNIYGIEFIDEGFTVSVNDVYSELTVQYLCRDVSMLTDISYGNIVGTLDKYLIWDNI